MKILADVNTRKNDIAIFLCFLVAAGLLLWAVYASWIYFKTTPPYVDRKLYPVMGIDVSSHNGIADYRRASEDGVEFVWIKASEGETFKDRNFYINYHNAGDFDIKRGAYHFFRFDKDGVAQALNLLDVIGDRQLEMGVAIDIESSGNPDDIDDNTVKERIATMVEYLNLRGLSPTLYCNKKDYFRYLKDSFPGHSLWICALSEDQIASEWDFWQYTHTGSINGLKGNVDINVFGGSRADWDRFLSSQQYQGSNSVN